MANKSVKQKLAFPVGLIVVILAAIGLITVVLAGAKGIGAAIDRTKHYEEYEKFLTPVVLIDPDSFDDITKAEMSQLMEISIWSLLKNDAAPDSFESNDKGLSIPKSAVEEEFVELFGTEVNPVHGTIEGYGIDFSYDNTTETYTVPLTGVTPIYTPDVVKISKTTDTVVLTVACVSGNAWEQSENGEMVAPNPDKYIRVTLRENDGNLFISAIQNTTAPETATTVYNGSNKLEDVNVIDEAETVETTTQPPESTTEASSENPSEAASATESTTADEDASSQ
ncbi:MAG: hypothetical protein IJZ16_09210 [Clostridia bacterium]|nr:hypothetical protein [Clostridia bacterium]